MKLRKPVKDGMEVLGIRELHWDQLRLINALLDGNDIMIVAPMSFGKSLIYQIPAVTSDGLTVEICPCCR